MRKVFVSIVLGLVLALGGCTAKDIFIRDPATLVTPAQKAQAAISQAKVTWASLSKSARADRQAGLYTNDQWHKVKDGLLDVHDKIEDAQDYLDTGLDALAGDKVAAVNAAIALVKVELAKKIAKEQK